MPKLTKKSYPPDAIVNNNSFFRIKIDLSINIRGDLLIHIQILLLK